ncbi:hypothetical protein A4X13_0g8784 [Tilletia indica]|uniref:Uncharacterized protein n=1 Tax=Tilletia indica TaxID=43049 RepID=A0A177TS18_9BASI|nr:hypothetical protein A4X13_0g8784 [Tilletia indica]
MTSTRNGKWVTHLALCADLVFGNVTSTEFNHDINTTLYDGEDTPRDAMVSMWARDAPAPGAYLATILPMATSPLRIAVPELSALRQIPEDFDGEFHTSDLSSHFTDPSCDAGTNPANPMLPTTIPILMGVAVVKVVDETRKLATLAGFTFLGKVAGWVEWELEASFEDTPRWAAWTFPAARTLISFEGAVTTMTEKGAVSMTMRRIVSIGSAPQSLVLALGVAQTQGNDRAARILAGRAAATASSPTKTPSIDKPTEQTVTELDGVGGEQTTPTSSPLPPPMTPSMQMEPTRPTSPSPTSRRKKAKVD